MMRVTFEINEVVIAEAEDVPNDQPQSITVLLPEDWVQMTYEGLVSAPNGDHVAYFDREDGWWHYNGMKFSDVIISDNSVSVNERLEYLRGEIEAERISMEEILELEGLADEGLIPDHELELLQWANVPEFGDARARASRNA